MLSELMQKYQMFIFLEARHTYIIGGIFAVLFVKGQERIWYVGM